MAELVGDHALQFLARQPLQGAARDADRRVLRTVAGGEGVDGRVVVDDVARGNGQARGQGHLLHHVEVASFGEVGRAARHQPAAQARRHRGPALGELDDADQASAQDHDGRQPGRAEEEVRLPPGLMLMGQLVLGEDRRDIERSDERGDRGDQKDHQPGGPTTGLVLGPEEIHGGGHRPSSAQKATFGAARSASLSTLKKSAGVKPKLFATTTWGKVSRAVL